MTKLHYERCLKEQFCWKSKSGDSIYIGYGIEKIKELKIELIEKEITDSRDSESVLLIDKML